MTKVIIYNMAGEQIADISNEIDELQSSFRKIGKLFSSFSDAILEFGKDWEFFERERKYEHRKKMYYRRYSRHG